jgi:hypothetical protein
MNDAYYPEQNGYKEGVPPDTCRINLDKIIDSVLASNANAEILLQTMDWPLGIHRARRPAIADYYTAYHQAAAARNYRLADHAAVWKTVLDYDTAFYISWTPDSIHPNAAGGGAITLPGVLSLLTGAQTRLTAPAPEAVFTEGADILLTAETNVSGGRVDFYVGKNRVGSGNAAPYSFTWKPSAAGKYLLLAKTVQNNFNVAISAGVTVRVEKPSPISPRVHRNTLQGKGAARAFQADGRVQDPEFRTPVLRWPRKPSVGE